MLIKIDAKDAYDHDHSDDDLDYNHNDGDVGCQIYPREVISEAISDSPDQQKVWRLHKTPHNHFPLNGIQFLFVMHGHIAALLS